ncbi:uncharacterized protein LOC135848641 [Planococcus citri]|uniref:uncharacterized protein LOC135848641 n=1 Tax=Planococcus citri TaxID=170843 RepID=UPI0031F7678A
MTVKMKIINVCLMSAHLFLGVLGDLQITVDQFAAFKGFDPTKLCKNPKCLENICYALGHQLGLINGNQAFSSGYPRCEKFNNVILYDNDGGVVTKELTLPLCLWPSAVAIAGTGDTVPHKDVQVEIPKDCNPTG